MPKVDSRKGSVKKTRYREKNFLDRYSQLDHVAESEGPRSICFVHNHKILRVTKVFVNIYHLWPKWVNGVLQACTLGGGYHSAIEIFGKEFQFRGSSGVDDGIYETAPAYILRRKSEEIPEFKKSLSNVEQSILDQVGILHERRVIGLWSGCIEDFQVIIRYLKDKKNWKGKNYRILSFNCNHFVKDLCSMLLRSHKFFHPAKGMNSVERMVKKNIFKLTDIVKSSCFGCITETLEEMLYLRDISPIDMSEIFAFRGRPCYIGQGPVKKNNIQKKKEKVIRMDPGVYSQSIGSSSGIKTNLDLPSRPLNVPYTSITRQMNTPDSKYDDMSSRHTPSGSSSSITNSRVKLRQELSTNMSYHSEITISEKSESPCDLEEESKLNGHGRNKKLGKKGIHSYRASRSFSESRDMAYRNMRSPTLMKTRSGNHSIEDDDYCPKISVNSASSYSVKKISRIPSCPYGLDTDETRSIKSTRNNRRPSKIPSILNTSYRDIEIQQIQSQKSLQSYHDSSYKSYNFDDNLKSCHNLTSFEKQLKYPHKKREHHHHHDRKMTSTSSSIKRSIAPNKLLNSEKSIYSQQSEYKNNNAVGFIERHSRASTTRKSSYTTKGHSRGNHLDKKIEDIVRCSQEDVTGPRLDVSTMKVDYRRRFH